MTENLEESTIELFRQKFHYLLEVILHIVEWQVGLYYVLLVQCLSQPVCTSSSSSQTSLPLDFNIKNHSISPQTIHRHLKKAGMKAVVKQKRPLLSKHHRRERLDFALSHQDWTVDD